MSSRDAILGRLRKARKPFPTVQPPAERLQVTPISGSTAQELTQRFFQEAEALSCQVQLAADDQSAKESILNILKGQKQILAWDFSQIPCKGLRTALHEAGITTANDHDDTIPFGISGADAALAATGSLLITTGPGRPRTTALLPVTHIAVITQDQILPNFEFWLAGQRDNDLTAFKESANINIISGPSKTADISMELIHGMHGPKELHIIIIAN